ncbi:MAG: hypothetical protein AABW75_03785 [Nanoarchaeota archaeon]
MKIDINDYYKPIMKREVSHHAAVAIIESENKKEFLFDVYGDNYAILDYHSRINLIGGNHNDEDISPWDIWKREIEEEFSLDDIEEKGENLTIPGKSSRPKGEFAPLEDILTIRNEIIKNARPYKDFYFETPSLRMFKDEEIIKLPIGKCIYSVFLSSVNNDLFGEIKTYLREGKAIKQEGQTCIRNIEQLIKEEPLCAAGTGLIMNDYLGVNIPNPDNAKLEYLGKPRNFMQDYLLDFEYKRPVRTATG